VSSSFNCHLYWAFACRQCGPQWLQQVEAVIDAGVTMIQLRQKHSTDREIYEYGRQLHALTRRLQVPLIVNDRLDLMLALNAEGVHLGTNDLPLAQVRALAPDRIIGYSANTPARLREAEVCGADYVGIGPVFATSSKSDTGPVLGISGLQSLLAHANLPAVAIGGITIATAAAVRQSGVAGICVISAISAATDAVAATRALASCP